MRRFAYVLLALIWIAGIWIWFQRAPDAGPGPSVPPSVPALEAQPVPAAKLDSAAAPRKLPTARHRQRIPAPSGEATPAIVRVKSSVGLPLLWVEVSVAGEDWQRVDLPESGLEVELEAYPLRVRAAGHLETDV